MTQCLMIYQIDPNYWFQFGLFDIPNNMEENYD